MSSRFNSIVGLATTGKRALVVCSLRSRLRSSVLTFTSAFELTETSLASQDISVPEDVTPVVLTRVDEAH